MQFQISGQGRWIPNMRFDPEPVAAAALGLDAPPVCTDNSLVLKASSLPARSTAQFATKFPKFFRQQRIQFEPRQTQSRLWQTMRGKTSSLRKKTRCHQRLRSGFEQQFKQTQSPECLLPVSTDEFPTDSMARIMAHLPNDHRDALPPQADAQSQSGQPTADDCDRFNRTNKYTRKYPI